MSQMGAYEVSEEVEEFNEVARSGQLYAISVTVREQVVSAEAARLVDVLKRRIWRGSGGP